jgi:hypothetical protein
VARRAAALVGVGAAIELGVLAALCRAVELEQRTLESVCIDAARLREPPHAVAALDVARLQKRPDPHRRRPEGTQTEAPDGRMIATIQASASASLRQAPSMAGT